MERRPFLMERWPTGVVLMLLLTAALLPLGLVLAWVAQQSVWETRRANVARAETQGLAASQAIESLLARNVLALRVASNAALASSPGQPCEAAARSLAVAPAVAQRFRLRNEAGTTLCTIGSFPVERDDLVVAPGAVTTWVSPRQLVHYRVGVIGGSATGVLTIADLQEAADEPAGDLYRLSVSDGTNEIAVINRPLRSNLRSVENTHSISSGQLRVRVVTPMAMATSVDRAIVYLPLVMWVAAALLSWLLVRRLLLSFHGDDDWWRTAVDWKDVTEEINRGQRRSWHWVVAGVALIAVTVWVARRFW